MGQFLESGLFKILKFYLTFLSTNVAALRYRCAQPIVDRPWYELRSQGLCPNDRLIRMQPTLNRHSCEPRI
jgi:hypothetical protein